MKSLLSKISAVILAIVLVLTLSFNVAAADTSVTDSEDSSVDTETQMLPEDDEPYYENEILYEDSEMPTEEITEEEDFQADMASNQAVSIVTDRDNYDGIVGESFRIRVTAPGKVSFKSSDKTIATVSSKGLVKLLKTGKVIITIKSAATSNHSAETLKKTIRSYPKTLATPELTIKEMRKTRVDLQWNKVKNAAEYRLLKKNASTGKYVCIKAFDKSVNEATITRNMGRYSIRAVRYVHGTKITNPKLSSVYIPGLAASAKTYSSIKIIRDYKPDNGTLKQLAIIKGASETRVPQSLSFTGKEYVVSYVNMDGTKGRMISYHRNGKLKEIGPLLEKKIGHANGSTYNPNTKKIYTVKTHSNIKSSKCTVLSSKTFKVTKTFDLPKIASGIAYDESTNKYYVSKGNEIYVLSSSFKHKKTISKLRYNHAQDIGAYNGVVMVCTWVSGKTSYVDLYRASNGKYLGTYSFCFNEIESVIVDDGYLVIIMNHTGDNNDFLYKTTERITLNTD